jgi:hypothetical protein
MTSGLSRLTNDHLADGASLLLGGLVAIRAPRAASGPSFGRKQGINSAISATILRPCTCECRPVSLPGLSREPKSSRSPRHP